MVNQFLLPISLIQKGIHVTTERYKEQVFSAVLSGLEMGNGVLEMKEDSGLVWDGKRTGDCKLSYNLSGMEFFSS